MIQRQVLGEIQLEDDVPELLQVAGEALVQLAPILRLNPSRRLAVFQLGGNLVGSVCATDIPPAPGAPGRPCARS